jgi:hypothetical protein
VMTYKVYRLMCFIGLPWGELVKCISRTLDFIEEGPVSLRQVKVALARAGFMEKDRCFVRPEQVDGVVHETFPRRCASDETGPHLVRDFRRRYTVPGV